MPFDGIVPDVFSLDGLIGWLETQDPATEYDYWNCRGGCLLSQYLYANGIDGSLFRNYGRLSRQEGVGSVVACEPPHTYGAALERARALKETV